MFSHDGAPRLGCITTGTSPRDLAEPFLPNAALRTFLRDNL